MYLRTSISGLIYPCGPTDMPFRGVESPESRGFAGRTPPVVSAGWTVGRHRPTTGEVVRLPSGRNQRLNIDGLTDSVFRQSRNRQTVGQ